MLTPRWHLRFDNFAQAFGGLAEAVELWTRGDLNDLAKAGMIQRFEYTWELAWKVMRDYLADAGNPVSVPSAMNVIRAAFAINLIEDGDAWVAMAKARNVMAHEYDPAAFEVTVVNIASRFFPLIADLRAKLETERALGN